MTIRHMKKKEQKYQVPITSLSLHWAIYLHNPVYLFTFSHENIYIYIFAGQGSSLLLNMQNIHLFFIIAFVYLCATYCILMQLNSQ